MRVGRNDPCPCGSGRKYKKCCLPKEPADKPPQVTTNGKAGTEPTSTGRHLRSEERFVPSGLTITPYTIAKLSEDPRVLAHLPELRRAAKRYARENWTLSKIASMSTTQIEAQLRAYGVKHTPERFRALADAHAHFILPTPLPKDLDLAVTILKRGLTRAKADPWNGDVLSERLAEIQRLAK